MTNHTGIKHLQILCLLKDLEPEYMRTPNSKEEDREPI